MGERTDPAWTGFPGAADGESLAFYADTLRTLSSARIPFLLGGAYAFHHYTGIERHTKDLDVFVRRTDLDAALAALARAGLRTSVTFPHWLAKVHHGGEFIDVIFGAGNGIAQVDDEWFRHSVPGEVLGVPVALTPVEEMIWSKAFVMERERYDGADIAHLLRARAQQLDWERLLRRFSDHWPVLLSHLVLFTFIYPDERGLVPRAVLEELIGRLRRYAAPDAGSASRDPSAGRRPTCRGTLLSRRQYLIDVDRWGYRDGRLPPSGRMTDAEIAAWTAAIEEEPG